MGQTSYLKQVGKGRTWYFQRAVPADVKPLLSKSKSLWSVSLQTDSRSLAEQLVHKHIAQTEEIIRLARLRANQSEAIKRLGSVERRELEHAGGVDALAREIEDMAISARFVEGLEVDADPRHLDRQELVNRKLDIAGNQARVDQLHRMVESGARLLRKVGVQVDEVQKAIRAKAPGLNEVLDHYVGAGALPEQTKRQYGYAVRRFIELNGDLAIDDLTKDHLREFARIAPGLPASHKHECASLPILEAVAEVNRLGLQTISPATVTKHLTALRALTKHAAGTGFAEVDPFDGFRHKQPREKLGAARQKRRTAFAPDELTSIVGALNRALKPSSDDYWIPLVALYQGARLEEICQLELTDLGTEDGVAYMDITDEGQAGKKVKNAASIRRVPIHPKLVEMGLLDHAKRSSDGIYLFSTLEADARDRRGGAYGKRFGRFLRKAAGVSDTRKVFHSFRHSWTDAARNANLASDVRHRLAGRELRGSEGGYGEGHSLAHLLHWMSKVNPMMVTDAPHSLSHSPF